MIIDHFIFIFSDIKNILKNLAFFTLTSDTKSKEKNRNE